MSRIHQSRIGSAQRMGLLALGIVMLWGATLSAQQGSEREAKQLLESSRRSYQEKNYQAASARFREFLTKYGAHKDAPAARYGLALTLLESPEHDFNGALEPL